jgi:hypothetical protein
LGCLGAAKSMAIVSERWGFGLATDQIGGGSI